MYPSVMSRDGHFIERKQEMAAINHMRDIQHMNENVGWIF